jgi:hypothetical protein
MIEVEEPQFRTLLDMHAEAVCRVERVAIEELTKLTSHVRTMLGLTAQDMKRDEQRRAQISADIRAGK